MVLVHQKFETLFLIKHTSLLFGGKPVYIRTYNIILNIQTPFDILGLHNLLDSAG